MFLTALSVFQERVPLFGGTVQEFIIGAVAFVVVAAIAFWFWGKLKGAL